MNTVLFTNRSSKDFECKYDGSGYRFKAGESRWMKEGIAKHFAKKLAERELLDQLKDKTKSIHPSVFEKASAEFLGEKVEAASDAEADMLAEDANIKQKMEAPEPKPSEDADEELSDDEPENEDDSTEPEPEDSKEVIGKEKPCCGSKGSRHKKDCPEKK